MHHYPKPILAVIFLFVIDPKGRPSTKEKDKEDSKDEGTDGEPDKVVNPSVLEELIFITQKIPNTCGTVALFHALLNNMGAIDYGILLYPES